MLSMTVHTGAWVTPHAVKTTSGVVPYGRPLCNYHQRLINVCIQIRTNQQNIFTVPRHVCSLRLFHLPLLPYYNSANTTTIAEKIIQLTNCWRNILRRFVNTNGDTHFSARPWSVSNEDICFLRAQRLGLSVPRSLLNLSLSASDDNRSLPVTVERWQSVSLVIEPLPGAHDHI